MEIAPHNAYVGLDSHIIENLTNSGNSSFFFSSIDAQISYPTFGISLGGGGVHSWRQVRNHRRGQECISKWKKCPWKSPLEIIWESGQLVALPLALDRETRAKIAFLPRALCVNWAWNYVPRRLFVFNEPAMPVRTSRAERRDRRRNYFRNLINATDHKALFKSPGCSYIWTRFKRKLYSTFLPKSPLDSVFEIIKSWRVSRDEFVVPREYKPTPTKSGWKGV